MRSVLTTAALVAAFTLFLPACASERHVVKTPVPPAPSNLTPAK